MGWQDDARKTVISEKRSLKSMVGYWVKVRKWSIRGKDEIDAAVKEVQRSLDRKALFEVAKMVRGIAPEELEKMDSGEIMSLLTPEQFSALTDSLSTQAAKVVEAKLRHGIDSHNFCEGDIDTRSTDKDVKGFAYQILDFPEVATELLELVEDFNRPLPRPTSSTSGTSPSGSTKEASSSTEISTQADENQPL